MLIEEYQKIFFPLFFLFTIDRKGTMLKKERGGGWGSQKRYWHSLAPARIPLQKIGCQESMGDVEKKIGRKRGDSKIVNEQGASSSHSHALAHTSSETNKKVYSEIVVRSKSLD